jgi:hypothetical protein
MRWHSGWPPAGCSSTQPPARCCQHRGRGRAGGGQQRAVVGRGHLPDRPSPLVGALVATVGVGPAFLVNAASFAAFALLAGLRLPGRPPATAAGSWLARIGEGARLLVAHRLLRLLALVQLLAALSAGATSALLVVLAGQQLDVGPDGSGCCWPPSASARRLVHCCWPGWSATHPASMGVRATGAARPRRPGPGQAVYYLGGILLLVAGAIGFGGLPPGPGHHDAQPTAPRRLTEQDDKDFRCTC